jgi:hypothetical protein
LATPSAKYGSGGRSAMIDLVSSPSRAVGVMERVYRDTSEVG